MSLKIQTIASSKDKIKQPKLAEQGYIPQINTSTILSGRSGSGKSVALANLITRKDMLGGNCFDEIYLISPTALGDDIQKSLGIPDENIFTDVIDGINKMKDILEDNMAIIESVGSEHSPKICLIYDDCVGDKKLLREPFFIKSFIACRHYCCTTFICTQSFNAVPRIARLQASNVIVFACSLDETKVLCESFCPARYSKREFADIIHHATRQPYSFMYINMKAKPAERFRKNFDTILNLDRLE